MKNKIIIDKTIRLLEHLYASKSLAKKVNTFKVDLENGEIIKYTYAPEQYYTFSYFSSIYEEMKLLVIDIATPLRQIIEDYERYGMSISKYIKFTSIGVDRDNKSSHSFIECLSKIIHAKSIEYEMEDENKTKSLGYEIGEVGWFTGKLYVKNFRKDGGEENIIIDIEKFCFNVLTIMGVEQF